MMENVDTLNYPLNEDFVAAACALPSSYEEAEYLLFLDTWGTDVVVEVNLGQKSTVRYDTGRVDFVLYAAEEYPTTISYNGFYNGYKDSLLVDMTTYSQTATTTGGQLLASFQTGDVDFTEPISISLISMDDVFDSKYWTLIDDYRTAGLCDWPDLSELLSRQINVLLALEIYVESKSIVTPSDPSIVTAVTWPEGTYGFPEVDFRVGDECPTSPDFTYQMGWAYQDTLTIGSNDWSDPMDLKGPIRRNNLQQNFCNKEMAEPIPGEWKWMKGEYCIFRVDGCPPGFLSGYVYWDDESVGNNNDRGGSLPYGVYTENTLIYYCCRQDAPPDNVIYLPTDVPFALIKRTENCPKVFGMQVSHQWIYWDCSNVNPQSTTSGFHPYETGGQDNHLLHYCVYTPN
ncbi:uncharacterized protein [Ptychodera flava]|uniref:uncharacterized protein n=1 Tax=Ptychodera flava TaxID=63121 RepID=UPI003969F391